MMLHVQMLRWQELSAQHLYALRGHHEAHLTAYRRKRPTDRASSCCPLQQYVLRYHTQQLRLLYPNRTSGLELFTFLRPLHIII